jgi:RNA polymerase primary sigma factor
MFTAHRPHARHARTLAPLEVYFRDIHEAPLLTAQEEKVLASRIAAGDAQARDRLVRANLRLVVKIARYYAGRGLPLPDLIAEGNLGLLRAVERYDPGKGTRFSTYASHWIKESIRRGLVNTARTVRLPAYMEILLSKWRRAAQLREGRRVAPRDERYPPGRIDGRACHRGRRRTDRRAAGRGDDLQPGSPLALAA